MFLIDSHCHLDLLNYKKIHLGGVKNVLKKSNEKNIKLILTVSTSIKNFYYLIKFTNSNKNILLSCGIHPCHSSIETNEILELQHCSKNKIVSAIGETGLDYYHDLKNKKYQQLLFREHIRISKKLNKPLLIHTRKSIDDIINILKEEHAEQCKVILHSCTENVKMVRILLDMGFYISFSGIVTFKNADIIRETAKFVPMDRILIETDSPYLSPVPYRGKENQPAYLYEIMVYIAKLKKIKPYIFATKTTENFIHLFNLQSNLLD